MLRFINLWARRVIAQMLAQSAGKAWANLAGNGMPLPAKGMPFARTLPVIARIGRVREAILLRLRPIIILRNANSLKLSAFDKFLPAFVNSDCPVNK